jgi:cell division protein FtsZ
MGGGTGTGAAPVIAKAAREMGILTVGVVTKPFHFEGQRRMRFAESGITELHKVVDTLLIIPNQNLFRVANEKTTFADAFAMADQVLYSGVACITDLMVKEGLINLDFADVRAVMREMGKAMMGTGEASGEKRALAAAEAAIANPLIDDASMKGARGLLISITGGRDLTLYEVDEAATRIREEVDQDANIIVGATFDESLDGIIRVSVVATGIDQLAISKGAPMQAQAPASADSRIAELTQRLRADSARLADRVERLAPAPAAAAPMTFTAPSAPPAAAAPFVSPAPAPVSAPAATMAPPTAASQHAAPAMMASDTFESAAQAAVAAAVLSPVGMDEVTLRPIPVKPSLFPEPVVEAPARQEQPVPRAFIPPQPERAGVRQPRMPRIDELPLPGQAELRAKMQDAEPPKERRTLLQRLASVGLGRRDEEEEQAPVRSAQPPQNYQPLPPRSAPAPRASDPQGGPVSDYAKRAAPQGIDSHGRPAPVNKSYEDDQLDIPAFLRRQAN